MPQLSSGLASSRSARPDPEDELLESLERRDALVSKKLLLQLVHRRGVAVLASLHSRSLALEPDQQGWIWLNQLLEAEELPVERVSAAVPPQLTALDLTEQSLPTQSAASAEVRKGSVALDLRAEAAVDAAFEALSAEFPGYVARVAPKPEPPQPQPFLGGEPQAAYSFVIPPSKEFDLAISDLAPTASEPPLEDQPTSQADPASEAGDEPDGSALRSSLWSRAEEPISRLRNRLRGRLSLTRVRTLVDSCIEEAVSSLQGPGPGTEPQFRQPPGTPPAHQAPVAAFGSPPALLSATQNLAQRLLSRDRDDSRPAPAPQSLSDLRGWLASNDDLPRAS